MTKKRDEHRYIVTVSGCTQQQADRVIAERINHDEDYGFDYSIDFVAPRTRPRSAS